MPMYVGVACVFTRVRMAMGLIAWYGVCGACSSVRQSVLYDPTAFVTARLLCAHLLLCC